MVLANTACGRDGSVKETSEARMVEVGRSKIVTTALLRMSGTEPNENYLGPETCQLTV